MKTTQTRLITYTEIRDRAKTNSIRTQEVPLEHFVSLPIPTMKWGGKAGYAFFAGPTSRKPGQAAEQGGPDRWWVADALSGKTILYALFAAISFGGEGWNSTQLPAVTVTIAQLRESQNRLSELMDSVVTPFFEGETGDPALRQETLESLTQNIPAPIFEQYQAIGSDFFEWLSK